MYLSVKNVTIGAYTIEHDFVSIGYGTTIGPQCILGEPIAGYYDNPGYANPPSHRRELDNPLRYYRLRRRPAWDMFRDRSSSYYPGERAPKSEITFGIGTLSDIQGHCEIGNYVRLHSNVHIGQESKIGNFDWIFPFTVLTNDPHPPSNELIGVTIDDFAVVATMPLCQACM